MSHFFHRSYHALLGAILGGLTVLTANLFIGNVNLILVGVAAAICGILSYFWGEPFIDWLKDFWWRF